MKSWLYPGAPVVCVDDRPHGGSRRAPSLVKNSIYIVAAVNATNGVAELAVEGLPRIPDDCRDEYGTHLWHYRASRFAPVTTTKINTDAAVSEMRELMRRAAAGEKVRV